jgi:hypothetical protein
LEGLDVDIALHALRHLLTPIVLPSNIIE